MDLLKLRQDADLRFDIMLADRREYEPWWRELRRQFAPGRGRFSVDEKPVRGGPWRNSRPRQIPDDFAAGMKSGLTSPSRPWFTLTLYDTGNYNENEDVKAWLTAVQDRMQSQMLRSNLYDQLFDVYKEQGIFGTGALLIEEDDEDVFRATCLTIGSYCIGTDKRGRVNRFGRQFQRTLPQLAEEFGEEALPQELRQRLKDIRRGARGSSRERYELRHLIEPAEGFMREDGPEGRFKYRSLWWLAGYKDPEFLRQGGYEEMPVMVPRWRVVNGDLYGREQPGDIGLDDAKTLQALEKDERTAIKKGANPALLAPDTLAESEIHDEPGGVTFYTPQGGAPAVTPLYLADFKHKDVALKRQELTAHLEETFYVNMFKMWTTDQRQGRTATEIEAREAEKMFMLGPLVERQQSEMLDPLIERIYAIMSRAGLFDDIPVPEELAELGGQEIKVEYMSILANLQKQASFAGLKILLETTAQAAQLQAANGYPEVLDKLDLDEVIDQIADMYVIPAGVVLGDDAVAEKRAMRQQQEAEAQAQQQLMAEAQATAQAAPQVSRAMKDLGETQMPGGGNGLEAMAGMMGGQTGGAGV